MPVKKTLGGGITPRSSSGGSDQDSTSWSGEWKWSNSFSWSWPKPELTLSGGGPRGKSHTPCFLYSRHVPSAFVGLWQTRLEQRFGGGVEVTAPGQRRHKRIGKKLLPYTAPTMTIFPISPFLPHDSLLRRPQCTRTTPRWRPPGLDSESLR